MHRSVISTVVKSTAFHIAFSLIGVWVSGSVTSEEAFRAEIARATETARWESVTVAFVAVAAGLILATAIRLMSTLRASLLGPWLAAAFVVVTFVTIAIVRLPLIWVVIGLGGVAIAIAWWQLR